MDLKDAERIWMSKAEAFAYVQRVFPRLTTGQHDPAVLADCLLDSGIQATGGCGRGSPRSRRVGVGGTMTSIERATAPRWPDPRAWAGKGRRSIGSLVAFALAEQAWVLFERRCAIAMPGPRTS